MVSFDFMGVHGEPRTGLLVPSFIALETGSTQIHPKSLGLFPLSWRPTSPNNPSIFVSPPALKS